MTANSAGERGEAYDDGQPAEVELGVLSLLDLSYDVADSCGTDSERFGHVRHLHPGQLSSELDRRDLRVHPERRLRSSPIPGPPPGEPDPTTALPGAVAAAGSADRADAIEVPPEGFFAGVDLACHIVDFTPLPSETNRRYAALAIRRVAAN